MFSLLLTLAIIVPENNIDLHCRYIERNRVNVRMTQYIYWDRVGDEMRVVAWTYDKDDPEGWNYAEEPVRSGRGWMQSVRYKGKDYVIYASIFYNTDTDFDRETADREKLPVNSRPKFFRQ